MHDIAFFKTIFFLSVIQPTNQQWTLAKVVAGYWIQSLVSFASFCILIDGFVLVKESYNWSHLDDSICLCAGYACVCVLFYCLWTWLFEYRFDFIHYMLSSTHFFWVSIQFWCFVWLVLWKRTVNWLLSKTTLEKIWMQILFTPELISDLWLQLACIPALWLLCFAKNYSHAETLQKT